MNVTAAAHGGDIVSTNTTSARSDQLFDKNETASGLSSPSTSVFRLRTSTEAANAGSTWTTAEDSRTSGIAGNWTRSTVDSLVTSAINELNDTLTASLFSDGTTSSGLHGLVHNGTATVQMPVPGATTIYQGGPASVWPTADDRRLSSMAVHFIAVGSLFIVVLILGAIHAYLHIRSERRARLFQAPPPPAERNYSTRRRSRRSGRNGSGGSSENDALAAAATERRIRMTVRMKPTKMFIV